MGARLSKITVITGTITGSLDVLSRQSFCVCKVLQLVTSESKPDKDKIMDLVRLHKGNLDKVQLAVTTSLTQEQFQSDKTSLVPMTELEAIMYVSVAKAPLAHLI